MERWLSECCLLYEADDNRCQCLQQEALLNHYKKTLRLYRTRNLHRAKRKKRKKEGNEEKPRRKAPIDALPSTAEEWAGFDSPDEVRDAFRQDTSYQTMNRSTIVKPMFSLYYLDLLVNQLQNISFTHLSLPVLQFEEVIAHDVVQSKSLSDLYHLRLSQVCTSLKLYHAVSYHQRAAGNVFINEYEQIRPLLMHPMILFALAAAAWHWLLQDIVPVYQIKGISKLVKLCLPKVQCFCDSLTSHGYSTNY
ncbi:unnamed protein product [Ranitomeya imitator]|uniref:Uncharacterized protein n=1 Tax=Ranitomeya imitator TaxID=111125 RepID=A0ABN9MLU2_9NEOB|nr:unnamed protein product [Ranitomeya imitator]